MSNPDGGERSAHSRDDVFDALADDERREILRISRERSPAGITKTELAAELAAVIADKPLASVTDDERRRALVDCRHRTLPALIDAGLLDATEDGTIVATDHRAFDDPKIEAVIANRVDDYGTDLDALFAALADARRRTVLLALETRYQPLPTETIARAIAAGEAGTTESEVSQDRVEEVLTTLVHVHLPRLNDAGLVGYDPETDSVSYEGHPLLSAGWLEDELERDWPLGNRVATS